MYSCLFKTDFQKHLEKYFSKYFQILALKTHLKSTVLHSVLFEIPQNLMSTA